MGVPNLSGINAALRREYNVYKGYEVSYEDTTINRITPKEDSEGIKRLKNQFGNISFDLSSIH
ncbi:MAG: hypothetical protein NC131_10510 [Roseburia sp.]|nr:hypothetical protein [Roseburia sp.]